MAFYSFSCWFLASSCLRKTSRRLYGRMASDRLPKRRPVNKWFSIDFPQTPNPSTNDFQSKPFSRLWLVQKTRSTTIVSQTRTTNQSFVCPLSVEYQTRTINRFERGCEQTRRGKPHLDGLCTVEVGPQNHIHQTLHPLAPVSCVLEALKKMGCRGTKWCESAKYCDFQL